ncbi:hypothetical protein PHLH4_45210 [Pseudomonas sp. St316]|nr:hypothetical protein PHLH4_45210 [Pseudomonas sp. St316]
MKCIILTAIALAALSISDAQAQQPTIPVNPPSIPGSPGTATPMPYPPVTPSGVPKVAPGSGGPPLLPPSKCPSHPRTSRYRVWNRKRRRPSRRGVTL